MLRTGWHLARIAVLGIVLLGSAAPVAAASPSPSYAATLTVDSACTFSARASWAHVKVSEVRVTWYMSGIERDPISVISPVHGRSATATRSLAVDSSTTRDFYASVAIYADGILLDTETTGTITAGCGFLL